MTKSAEELLSLRIGDTTVGENLQRAVASGKLTENPDGTVEIATERKPQVNWVFVNHGPSLDCGLKMYFIFRHAYDEGAVPYGCSACYKVKVVLRTLRQLVAAWENAKRMEYRSKWGVDLDNPYSQNVYAGYFYTSSLDAAQALYRIVSQKFSEEPRFGADPAITIKRGCSEYEVKLGRSENYTFQPEMPNLEAYLKTRFRERKVESQATMATAYWIETAFRMGDDTCLDFTGGKRLREKTMVYEAVGAH